MVANHKSENAYERRARVMLKPVDRQGSFYDADYICDQLIPQDCFFRKFREIVAPLLKDKQFEAMYCKDNGRPAISPSLLAMATILQFHKNLSDRDMEQACMYDIQIKYALGLSMDERPFDYSSLGDFRKRLLENGKEKEIFDRILSHLIKQGLIAQDVEKILSELVHTDGKGYKTLSYDKLTPVLIEAIKEQQAIIREQDKRNAEKDARITRLEKALESMEKRMTIIENHPKAIALK
jgi:transposase